MVGVGDHIRGRIINLHKVVIARHSKSEKDKEIEESVRVKEREGGRQL